MIDQVLPGIYRIEIPLPNNPLKATNAYIIRGEKRNLLVDTGFNTEVSRQAMDRGLQELGVKMENTDLFITHLHSDHSGLVKHLAAPDTMVWMSEADGNVVEASRDSSHWSMFNGFLIVSGLVDSGVENDFTKHPGYRFASEVYQHFNLIEEGFEIAAGDYRFQCVATPDIHPDTCVFMTRVKSSSFPEIISWEKLPPTSPPGILIPMCLVNICRAWTRSGSWKSILSCLDTVT
jgi:glyoxylase-like metal-dependent hydrolase (beta-lactamase superfamily II)